MTGLRNETLYIVDNISVSQNKLRETKEYSNTEVAIEDAVNYFERAKQSNTIEALVNSEKFFLEAEKTYLVRNENKQHAKSLEEGITNLSYMQQSITNVKDPSKYKIIDQSYRQKERKQGLPNDAFHKAVSGHITRLANRKNELGISNAQLKLIDARISNMQTAKKLYMDLQREALNIEKPIPTPPKNRKTEKTIPLEAKVEFNNLPKKVKEKVMQQIKETKKEQPQKPEPKKDSGMER